MGKDVLFLLKLQEYTSNNQSPRRHAWMLTTMKWQAPDTLECHLVWHKTINFWRKKTQCNAMCCIHIDQDRVESNMEIHFCHSNCCTIEHPTIVDISLLPIFKHKSPSSIYQNSIEDVSHNGIIVMWSGLTKIYFFAWNPK